MDEEPQKERSKQSDWNRSLDKIMRMNEAEGDAMNRLVAMEMPGGYSQIDGFLSVAELCFMLYQDTCKAEEVKDFYKLRDECRGIRDDIAKQATTWHGGGREKREGMYKMSREQIDKFRDLLRLMFKLQHNHGLGIKTSIRTTYADQEKNVMTEG